MATIDWIVLGVLLLSLLIGVWRGLVYEVLSVFVWIAAFIAAQWFAPDIAPKLPLPESLDALRYVLAFVVIFVLSAFVGGMLVGLVKKLIARMGLRPVDRTLGAVFGLFRGFILLLAMTLVINMTPLRSHAIWQESLSAVVLTDVLTRMKPLLPKEFSQYML